MKWNDEAKAQVIEYVLKCMTDGEPLTRILKRDLMPDGNTWRKWCDESGVLLSQYARARQSLGDAIAESVIDITDAAFDGESAQVARVKADARRWYAGKVNPAYSDKLDVGLSGNGGLTIVLGRFNGPVLEHEQPAPLPITTDIGQLTDKAR
jgi:hypothetical protein